MKLTKKELIKLIKTNGHKTFVGAFERKLAANNIKNLTCDQIIKLYSDHSFIIQQNEFKTMIMKKKEIKNSFQYKIIKNNLILKYLTCSTFDSIDEKIITKYYIQTMNSALKNKFTNIIIDLRNHSGGNMRPCIKSLKLILGKNSLFQFNIQNKNYDNNWLNCDLKLTKKASETLTKYKIAVLVGKKTMSSGEIIASIFVGRTNCKLFGQSTGGFMSINNNYNYDNCTVALTIGLVKTIDNKIHLQQKLYPCITNNPMTDAHAYFSKIEK